MKLFKNSYYLIVKDILVIVLLLVSICLLINKNDNNKKEIVESKKIEVKSDSSIEKLDYKENKINVDIKGAINSPGVYQMNSNSIINDLIEVAGGAKKNANLNSINLSKKLKDEMVIYIYTNDEIKKLKKKNNIDTSINVENKECNCNEQVIIPCEGASIINNEEAILEDNKVEDSVNKEVSDGKVNINTCSKEDLMSISGIGESKAKSIIEYRNNNGIFKSIEDIKNVAGIGDALFDKIKEYIKV